MQALAGHRSARTNLKGDVMRTAGCIVLACLIVIVGGVGPVPSPGTRAAAQGSRGAAACDRECLIGIAGRYLDALVAKDSTRAPLAASVRYTENGQRLVPG